MRQRSSYPKPFKAQVVQECLQPGATISSVAIHHGINANVIRKWLPIYRDQPVATLPAFVPVKPAPRRATEETVINAHEPYSCDNQQNDSQGRVCPSLLTVVSRRGAGEPVGNSNLRLNVGGTR